MMPLTLPPVVDLAAATALAETLRGAAGPVSLDGREVERIGVAGLQMLLSARAGAAAAGHALVVAAPSAALAAAAATIGAADLLTDR